MTYRYILFFNNYNEGFRALRKLYKREVVVHNVIIMVESDSQNKVKDLMKLGLGFRIPEGFRVVFD